MVKGGALTGEKVEAWRQRLDEQEALKTMKQRAEEGDVEAMAELGKSYRDGKNGATKDEAAGFRWHKLAADKGHIEALKRIGRNYLQGKGVAQCTFRALHYLTRAATRDSEHACYLLADAFARGLNGVPEDEVLARTWFTRMRSPAVARDGNDPSRTREEADKWLRDHPGPAVQAELYSSV